MPLNHVALTVRDREQSAAFYGELFGLTERVHDDGGLLILGSQDGSLLALSEGPVPEGLPGTNQSSPHEAADRNRLRPSPTAKRR